MTFKTGIILGACLSVLTPFVALGATPESGTLTLDSSFVEYGEGPFINFNQANYLGAAGGADYMCDPPVLECDEFALTVDLPVSLPMVFPSALLRMTFSFDDPTPNDPEGETQEDYDFFLLDANGNVINRAESLSNPEVIAQLAYGGVTEYTIVAIPYFAVNSSYSAKIELELGEPADGADVDEFFANNSVVFRALQPRAAETAPVPVAERKAAGSMSWFGLLALSLVFVRRRRSAHR